MILESLVYIVYFDGSGVKSSLLIRCVALPCIICTCRPAEDLSNCVSTSHSMDALDPVPAKDGNANVLQTVAVATNASSTVLPSLLTEEWNEERVQMRSRRRRKEKQHEEERKEEEEEVRAEVVQSLESRREADMEEFGGGV